MRYGIFFAENYCVLSLLWYKMSTLFFCSHMKKLVFRILLSALAVFVAAYLVPNVQIDSYRTAIVVAIVLALVNGVIWRVLKIITLPLNILTLWITSLIISVLMIMLVDNFVDWFATGGFISSAIFGLVLALINMVLGTKD